MLLNISYFAESLTEKKYKENINDFYIKSEFDLKTLNNIPIEKANGIFLVYWDPASSISVNLIFIDIKIKRNNTVMAPTYTIM